MKKYIFLILLLSIPVFVSAQAKKGRKKSEKKTADMPSTEIQILEDAEFYFNDENYQRALPYYVKLAQAHPNYIYYTLQAGICYLYKSDEKEKAIEWLESVKKISPETEDIDFYLGKAYHINYRFDEAIASFNTYISGKPSIINKVQAEKYIEFGKSGMQMFDNKMKVNIENMGHTINTSASEYVPVISADESVIIFTYLGERSTGGRMDDEFYPDPKGEYYEDVFISQRVGDQWLIPEGIGGSINTKQHDASIALSADGQKLFIFKSTSKDGGDIFMSTLIGDEWGEAVRLGPEVNTKYWEGSCSLSSDDQTLYFASERPGGFGGRDLWMSKKMPNGEWGKAENLGDKINTKEDEDAPFIHPDGLTLFFSSAGHNSMGGDDIMYSVLRGGKWSEPVNMGYPINTTDNDRYYVLSADGQTGYYSSGKKGGFGGQDIYTVTPGFFGEKPVLALVVGITKAQNKPTGAVINIINEETGKKQGTYNSNSSTGKYLIALSPGSKYKIAFEVDGYSPSIQYINVRSVDTYIQVQNDVELNKKEDSISNGFSIADTSDVLQKKLDEQVTKYKEEISSGNYEKKVYHEILKKRGDEEINGVQFNVELGTYQDAGDFYPARVTNTLAREKNPEISHIKSRVDENGNTTFSIGPFKTLLDAEIFKYKVYQSDSTISNSLVTVTDQGQRKLVQQYYASQYNQKGYKGPTDTKVIQAKSQGISTLQATDVDYGKTVKDYGKERINGMSYKVEIGAHADTANFKLSYLSKYGKIERKLYADGISRYSIGPFKTLAEADSLKALMVKNESAGGSFVTVFVFGKRKTVPEHYNKEQPLLALKREQPPKEEPLVAKADTPVQEEVKKEEPIKETPVLSEPLVVKADTPVQEEVKKEEPIKKTPVLIEPLVAKADTPVQEEVKKEEPIKETPVLTEPLVAKAEPLTVAQPKLEEPQMESVPCSPPTGNEDFAWFVGKDLNDKEVYNKLVGMAGSFCVEGLAFKVQIGAYRQPDNFKYKNLRKLEPPPAEITPYPDGITRFTMREFATLKEAEKFRQTVIKYGTIDAWITPFYNGKRMLMQELIAVNFYGKSLN